jgi:hypothetical protein
LIVFDQHWLTASVAAELRRRAQYGVANGRRDSRKYIERCKGFDQNSGCLIIFTRDEGHHASGWWKNPDYERCWHLSVSQREAPTMEARPRVSSVHHAWVTAFFGDDARSIWTEPPYSAEGKQFDVWHYRLFVRPDWKTALIPRSEVYSREFTEAGWLSYSDLLAAEEAAERETAERTAGGSL